MQRVVALQRRPRSHDWRVRCPVGTGRWFTPGAIIGLRFSEVAGLRLGRLDFSERSISVLETITRDAQGSPVFGPPKSTASRRTVALPATLVELLAEHVREQHLDVGDPDALMFTALGGGPIRYANWRNRVWVPACEAAGLQGIGLHSLRRASATALGYARVDLKTTQTRLGHSDPRLTLSIYAQAVAKADRSAADVLGARFLPQLPTTADGIAHESRTRDND